LGWACFALSFVFTISLGAGLYGFHVLLYINNITAAGVSLAVFFLKKLILTYSKADDTMLLIY
jgi:hypothetical protein